MNYFQLLEKLDGLYDSLEGKTLSSQAIVKKLNSAIPFKECKIVHVNSISSSNNVMISGLYDPDLDEEKKPCIELEVMFPKRRPKSTFEFSIDDFDRPQWRELCVDLASVLGHEYVHLGQFRKRGFRDGRYYTSYHSSASVRENQEYFGIPDEVDAYAFTCAVSMCENFPGPAIKMEDTVIYQIYHNLFDKRDKVNIKLRKLTTKYFKRLERQYHANNRPR